MKRLPPLPLRQAYYDPIKREIEKFFAEIIYGPLIRAVVDPESPLENSNDPLEEAVRSGRVWIEGGKVRGSFDSKISRILRALGATLNSRTKTWTLAATDIPPNVRMAQAQAESDFQAMRQRLITAIDYMDINGVEMVPPLSSRYRESLSKMDAAFQKSVASISIVPKMSAAMSEMISTDWAKNLSLYIKKWAAEDILELRQKVGENTFAGRRAKDLEKMLVQNYQVSNRKAKFLARQETSLLMSKFKESRYKDIGVQTYIWHGTMDEKERPDHRLLEGKEFFWTSPPVVDRKTGRRAHPGEDYNCRCIAVALVK